MCTWTREGSALLGPWTEGEIIPKDRDLHGQWEWDVSGLISGGCGGSKALVFGTPFSFSHCAQARVSALFVCVDSVSPSGEWGSGT